MPKKPAASPEGAPVVFDQAKAVLMKPAYRHEPTARTGVRAEAIVNGAKPSETGTRTVDPGVVGGLGVGQWGAHGCELVLQRLRNAVTHSAEVGKIRRTQHVEQVASHALDVHRRRSFD